VDSLQVQVVTPEATKFSGNARQVILPGVLGEMGILPQHAPLVSMLQPGRVRVITAEGTRLFAVAEGFATIANNQVVCLVDAAVAAEEIDATKLSARMAVVESEAGSSDRARSELAYLRAQAELK
jgi:F-type H+-transporting ATPase subunit epsilon